MLLFLEYSRTTKLGIHVDTGQKIRTVEIHIKMHDSHGNIS